MTAYFFPVTQECFLCPPTKEAWLGTDPLGRDIAVRLLRAWSLTTGIALGAAMLSTGLGTIVGLVAGSQRGILDSLLLIGVQTLWVVPALLWAALLAFVGGKNWLTLITAIGLSTWVETARLIRIETQKLWRFAFVEAGRALGLPHKRLLRRHVLPNLWPIVRTQFLQVFATATLIEAGLSFVGLGPTGENVSLGTLLFESIQWLTLPQGLVQGLLAGTLLSGTVFAVYSLTGYGRDSF